ncbi:exonuclease domain-containing protein [Lysinibacillus louembei]|uniref:Exonuclease domain-containing protein n=1 Tax=Lysinibacillus louembei TaxID=1470088 RepID=A0ABZ0RRZ9_9BACI|nr:exonuclease domain-containing protein [Lysinibacillus louembei]WPK10270.1 exonuclease domain-containing protein [Lysinibacillus louembei]
MGKYYKEKSINEIVEENEFVSVSGKMVSDVTVKAWGSGKGENLIFVLNDGASNLKCIIFVRYEDHDKDSIETIKNFFVKGHFYELKGKTSLDETYTNFSITSAHIGNINVPTMQLQVDIEDCKDITNDIGRRVDTDEIGRVEFKVISQYSTMQSIVKEAAAIELTNRFNYQGLGFVEKGTVRGFPLIEQQFNQYKKVMAEEYKNNPSKENQKRLENIEKLKMFYGVDFLVNQKRYLHYLVNSEKLHEKNSEITDEKFLRNVKYLVFDIETTGIFPLFHEMIEIGAIIVENGEVIKEFHELIKPTNKINQKISKLTNITNKVVAHGVDEETALRRFYEFIGDEKYILVGHNARDFDLNFINVRSRMYKLDEELNDFALIDTLYLSKFVEEEVLAQQRKRKNYSLKGMLKKYGIKIENHHRAVSDSLHTFKLFQKLLEDMEAHNKDLVACNEPLKTRLDMRFPQMVTLYALNREGLVFLNQLSSKVNTDTENRVLSWDDINVKGNRENILVVSNGFYCKDIFECLLNGKFDERVLDNYDVIGLNSPYSNHHYEDVPVATLKQLIKIVDGICQKQNKMVISLGEVLCLHKYEERYLDMLWFDNRAKIFLDKNVTIIQQFFDNKIQKGLAFTDTEQEIYNKFIQGELTGDDLLNIDIEDLKLEKQGGRFHSYIQNKELARKNVYYKSTEELLNEFDFLGTERVREIVSINTIKLLDRFSPYEIVPMHPLVKPSMLGGNEKEKMLEVVERRLKELYGEHVDKTVQDRLALELEMVYKGSYEVVFYGSYLLVEESKRNGYLVGSRGSVGSMLLAYVMGISEVNPLPPHYQCDTCKMLKFCGDEDVVCGFDLPIKRCACGGALKGNGFGIHWSSFMGYGGEKTPDVDLNFSSEIQKHMIDFITSLFGESNIVRAGTISTLAEGKSKKIIWEYHKAKGNIKVETLKERYDNDVSDFYELDDEGNLHPIDYIHFDKNNRSIIYIEKLKQEDNGEPLVEILAFDFDSLVFQETLDFLNGVAFSSGQHAGGMLVIPEELDVHYYSGITYSKDGYDASHVTLQSEYKPYEDAILKFDILSQDDSTRLYYLEKETGVSIADIDMYDSDVIQQFALGRTEMISEFNTNYSTNVTKQVSPQEFSDLVAISGLTHGEGLWDDNADVLLKNGKAIDELITSRENFKRLLIQYGIEETLSNQIVEFIRKGKLHNKKNSATNLIEWKKYEEILREYHVDEWFIQSIKKVKYLFPLAHAAAYVINAYRLAWFKKYYPLAFAKIMINLSLSDKDVDKRIFLKDREQIEALIKKYENPKTYYTLPNKTRESAAELYFMRWLFDNHIELLGVDENKSDAKIATIEDGKIRLPYMLKRFSITENE